MDNRHDPAPEPTPPPRWRAAAADALRWAGWDGDYVLYHRPSGKTHFVNAATHCLLVQVLCEPRDLPSAAAELAVRQDAGPEVDLQQYVASLLPRLEELGLVERA